MSGAIFCLCGHHSKYHSTQQPNLCSKCKECPYFRPYQRSSLNFGHGTKITLKARFDGICKVCSLQIKAGKHDIIRDSNGNWIHKMCSKEKEDQLP
jgi:hypothetical protein